MTNYPRYSSRSQGIYRREKRQRKKQRLRGNREANERKGAFEDLRAEGPLSEGATDVFGGEVQWTARYINTKRTGCACRPVNRKETAEFDLVRDHDNGAVTQLHEMAQRGAL